LKNKLEFAKSITAIAVAEVNETMDMWKSVDAEIRYLATSAKVKLVAKERKFDIC
jgi:hypothetical protein